RRALAAAERLGMPDAQADLLISVVGLEAFSRHTAEGRERLTRARELARAAGNAAVELRALYNLAMGAYEAGELEACLPWLTEGLDRARRAGLLASPYPLAMRYLRLLVLYATGRCDECVVATVLRGVGRLRGPGARGVSALADGGPGPGPPGRAAGVAVRAGAALPAAAGALRDGPLGRVRGGGGGGRPGAPPAGRVRGRARAVRGAGAGGLLGRGAGPRPAGRAVRLDGDAGRGDPADRRGGAAGRRGGSRAADACHDHRPHGRVGDGPGRHRAAGGARAGRGRGRGGGAARGR